MQLSDSGGLKSPTIRLSRELYREGDDMRVGMEVILSPEDFEAFRQGYLCPPPPHGCLARQESAFPEKCIEPYCNCNIKEIVPWMLQQTKLNGTEVDPWETSRANFEAAGGWLPDPS